MLTPHLDALGFVATDIARSLAFYRLLGLDIPADADTEPHVEHTLANGFRLMWDDAEVITGIDASWVPPSGGHRVALAFACASPEEVDRVYATVISGGFTGHLEPWDAFWGQRYATLHDPDGNAVDLFAPLA
ncbi:MAG: VOC family protein [Acidimicrobiales bacterium]